MGCILSIVSIVLSLHSVGMTRQDENVSWHLKGKCLNKSLNLVCIQHLFFIYLPQCSAMYLPVVFSDTELFRIFLLNNCRLYYQQVLVNFVFWSWTVVLFGSFFILIIDTSILLEAIWMCKIFQSLHSSKHLKKLIRSHLYFMYGMYRCVLNGSSCPSVDFKYWY